MTQSTEQERAGFTDGAWYWVEKEGWHDEPPKIAPAMYRADCDAWYSWEFSGISTEYLKVMEPCVRHEQAARRAPAVPVPQGLREAAQAVVERWDTPLWKDVPATTFYIANLRAALAAAHQPPDAFQTEGGLKSEIRTTSTAPVQMPEPAGCVVYANGESHHWDANRECAELFASSERSRGAPYAFTFENLYTEQQVRQLLADNGIGKDKA